MGLDVFAYKRLQPMPETDNRREWFMQVRNHQGHVTFSKDDIEDTEKDFPGRASGLVPGTYSWSSGHSFKVTYGGFDDWRSRLAQFAGGTSEKVWSGQHPSGMPFVELIKFYNNQGVIGPVVSAKLAADFVDNSRKYRNWLRSDGDQDFDDLSIYMDLTIAFLLAGDEGAIQFA